MMLGIRFTAGFVIVLLFVLHASVHAHQGGETIGEEAVVQKEFHGRKIGRFHEVLTASKNSGANRCDGKCEIDQGNCKYWNEKYRSHDHPTKVETADYRGPNRHPPKHN